MEKLFRSTRRWGMVAVVALASCGGGGDANTVWSITLPPGSVSNEANGTPPTGGGSVNLVVGGAPPGTYVIPSTSDISGMLLVHPDGHTLATAQVQARPGLLDDGLTTLFAGPLSPPDKGATGTVTFVFTTPKVVPEIGTATATLWSTTLDGVPAVTAWLTDETVTNPFGPQTYASVSVRPALHLLPMAKLAGHYYDAASGMDLVITSDGAVSGSYAANCAITALLAGYDPETTLFRMTATLAGTACSSWLQGSHEYLGNLGASESGHVMLSAYAISGSVLATLVFTHPQQLGTY
jgi:hypothetical protein